MRTPWALLRFVAKAALNYVGFGVAGDFAVEVLPDIAMDVWKWWAGGKKPEELKDEVEALTKAPAEAVKAEAEAVAAELAPGQPEKQQALVAYLTQIPGTVRRSLRRPADPEGQTVPPGLLLEGPEDLLPFLPTRMPRFKAGDRPPGVGDWELVELLGAGGFGEVWKARNPYTPSAPPVALKFCLDAAAARVLRNEAAVLDRVMRQGRHPGIVTLQHTYLSGDPPCLEYEYVSGGDLGALLLAWRRVPMIVSGAGRVHPVVAQATWMLHELAEVVAFAHGLAPAVVHRDLKPANVLVQHRPAARPAPRIADFGIGGVASRQALLQSKRRGSGASFLTTALRGSHTPLYASPQQIAGKAPDPRDDVHALGVVWYQMLTGDLSKGRPSGRGWKKQLAERGMKAELLDLLEACVDDEPDERPRDAAELAKRLAALLEEAPKAPPPPPARRAPPKDPDRPPATPIPPLGLDPPKPPRPPATPIPPIPPIPPADVRRTPSPPPRAPAASAVVVSRVGRGDYTSIAEAVRAAAPGTRIKVQPGVYAEALVLDRPVEIVGDGSAESIVVQSADAPAVLMRTDHALIRGLSLRGRGAAGGKQFYAVDAPQGRLVLEDCLITSDTLSAVAVHGRAADPILRRCALSDCAQNGLFVYDGGRGTFEDCVIANNGRVGVEIKDGAASLLRRCRIVGSKESGVFIHGEARGTLDGCEVSGNALAGVEIKQGADPELRRCKIHDGKQTGLFVLDDGRGTFDDCEVYANALSGVEIKKGGNPTLRRCKVRDGKQDGVFIWDNGRGVFEDCDVSGNGLEGVEVKQGGDPTCRGCRVFGQKECGLFVHSEGKGTFEACDIYGNTLAGVEVKQGGEPTLRKCTVRDGKSSGVHVHTQGRGVLEGCELFGNALSAVEIKQGGAPVVRGCKIHDGKQNGVFVWAEGRGVFENCDVAGNALAGVEVKQGGDPLLRRCTIRDGKQDGVFAWENGRGTFDDCHIYGNALNGVESKQGAHPVLRRCKVNRNQWRAIYVHEQGTATVEGCDLGNNQRGAWSVEAGCYVRRSGNRE
jgi:serine/threonine protein kinase